MTTGSRSGPAWLIFAVGLFLLLSAGAHAFLGWPMNRRALIAAGAGADLIRPLAIGWNFGGAAMAAFGLILLAAWRRIRAGQGAAVGGVIGVIAAAYLVFGGAALVYTDFNPHFLLFVVPGLLLAAGLWLLRVRP
ncbi:MAG: hypothetical protein ACRD5D_04720 [Candidatus Polarisedimenticolia bacterium]